MSLAAALCIGIGSYPWPLYALLPYTVDYSPFDATHVIAQLQLLFFSALALTWLKLSGLYPPELPAVNIDSEWVYRRLAPRFVHAAVAATRGLDQVLRDALAEVAVRGAGLFGHSHGATGTMARTWPIGPMLLLVVALLGLALLYGYV